MLRRVGSARRLRPAPDAEVYDPIILLASRTHRVPAALVKAVIAAEAAPVLTAYSAAMSGSSGSVARRLAALANAARDSRRTARPN